MILSWRGDGFEERQMKKLIVLLLVLGLCGVAWGRRMVYQPGALENSITVVIPKGAGSAMVAGRLAEAGVIEHPFLFRIAARLMGKDKLLRAGEYEFEPQISMAEAIEKLAEGDIVYHQLTVPEGLMSVQIAEILNKAPNLGGEPLQKFEEGLFLPETYTYKYGDTRQDVLREGKAAVEKVLAQAWKNREDDLPVKTPEELLILASIIEKETAVDSERAIVASVFVNRLRKGMKLQTDPTVIYALTEGNAELKRSLKRKDLQIDSPYNTYKYYGLPPKPICNPGAASIWAAAHPADTDYLFFVADGKGGHNFSRSLAEHNRSVRAWVKTLR